MKFQTVEILNIELGVVFQVQIVVAEARVRIVVLVFLFPLKAKIQVTLVLLAKLVAIFEFEEAILDPLSICLDHGMVL